MLIEERKGVYMLDKYSRDEILVKYLPLVERAARNAKIKSVEYDHNDLVSMGAIGLMDALDKFDPSRGVPFERYAYIRVSGSIIDEVRRNATVPRSRIQKLNEYYKVKEVLEQELKRTPTETEICSELGIDAKQLKDLHETVHMLADTSLDQTLFGDDDGGASRLDFIVDPRSPDPEKVLLDQELKDLLIEAVSQLDEREQTILQLIYKEDLLLKDIAYIFDISIPRVSQIHGQIIIKLREYIQDQESIR